MQTHFCSLEARLASTLYAQYAGYIQHWHFIIASQIWPGSSLTNFGGGARDGGGAGALVVGPGLLVVGRGPQRPPARYGPGNAKSVAGTHPLSDMSDKG